jgi:flagellar motor switch/type III secretory pathway protein FliN
VSDASDDPNPLFGDDVPEAQAAEGEPNDIGAVDAAPQEGAPAEPLSPSDAASPAALFSDDAPVASSGAALFSDDGPAPFEAGPPPVSELSEAESFDALEQRPAGDQPLISAEESDAIIAAMRAGSLRPAAEPAIEPSGKVHFKSAHEAQRTQLGAPDAPLRKAMELADRVCGDLADVVLDKLLQLASVIASASLLPSEVLSVETALEPYVATGAGWDVMAGTSLRGTVVIAGNLADVLLARRLGAADAVLKPGPRSRGLSPLGRRVLSPFADAILDCVARSFFGERKELRLVAAGSTPTKLAPFAPCLKFGVRARFGEIEDDVVVVLYDEALASAAPKEGLSTQDAWGRILSEVDVEIVARLGIAYASVRDFLALGTGSVLRLDGSPERPVSLLVDGTPVLSGMPIVHEGNLAIEVKS